MDMGALGRFEPSLTAVKIPRCASCGAANPQAAPRCSRCGVAAAPTAGIRQETSITVNAEHLIPWRAKALLAIGALLKRLALRIKGE
jgi:hypothetical protein